jgi:hypothetical protein
VSIPSEARAEVQDRVWRAADELGWFYLPAATRSRWYDTWTADKDIGGRLLRFMDPGQVRLYIKDALLKRYARARRSPSTEIMSHLGLNGLTPARVFIKPHGCLLPDGRVICWGPARTWKLVLMSVYERAFRKRDGSAYAAVLTQADSVPDPAVRTLVHDAALRLGIGQVAWVSG